MKKQITAFIQDLKSGNKLTTLDEASTKQGIVLRLLSLLGWDIFDVEEVYPDYSVNTTMISYALRIDSEVRLFIDVKSSHDKLEEHQKQLMACAAQDGVDLCVLTNGARWWFFLGADRSGRIHKRYYSCDFKEQPPEKIVTNLIDFMGRTKVAKGEALKSAKATYRSQRQKKAADALPEAWNRLLSPPNKILVEILSETTEKQCGYRADSNLVEKFIKSNLSRWKLKIPDGLQTIESLEVEADSAPHSVPQAKKDAAPTPSIKSYAGMSISAYGFNGHRQNVSKWEEMLLSLCEFLAAAHSQNFEKVLWISGHQRPYFSTNSEELRIPEKIKKTNIYVETKLKPDEIVKIAHDLVAEFGYDRQMLEITAD